MLGMQFYKVDNLSKGALGDQTGKDNFLQAAQSN